MATKVVRRAVSEVPAAALRHALRVVSPALPSRTTTPVLHHVLIAGGCIEATDGELRIKAVVHGGEFDSDLLLPASRLSRILNYCDEQITLASGGTSCSIEGCGNRWSLPMIEPSGFPLDGDRDTKPVARLPADQLVRAIKAVACATSKHDAQYATSCVLLEVADGTVTLAATDGRRLHVHSFEIDQAVDDASLVVPSRFMAALVRLAEQAGEDNAVQLESDRRVLIASAPDAVLTAPLSSSPFPDWRKAIPEATPSHTEVRAGDLLEATLAASITTSDTSRAVTFTFGEKSGIKLTAKSPEGGESSVRCAVASVGAACVVRLNPEYVVEFLEIADSSEYITIEAKDTDSHVVMRCEGTVAVLAPIAAQEA